MKRFLALGTALLLCLSACTTGASTTTPAPTPMPTVELTDASTEIADTRGIIGSYYSDITVGFEQFGLVEHSYTAAPDEAKDYFSHSSTAICDNNELDASLDYSLTIDNDHQIIGASFGVSWLAAQDNSIFIAGAQTYLGFAATMPYDSADTATAKAWVLDTIPTLVDRESQSTTIGDATFELIATAMNDNYTSFVLNIAKAEA